MGVRAKEPGLEAPVGGDRCSRIECGTLGATGAAAAAWATGLAGRRSRLLAYRITCAGGRVIGAKPRSTRRTPSTPTSPFERLNWGFTGFEKSVAGEGYAATCLHHWRTWHVPATGGTVHGSSRQPHRPERKRRKASGRAAERAHQASSSTRRRQSERARCQEARRRETMKRPRKRTPPPFPGARRALVDAPPRVTQPGTAGAGSRRKPRPRWDRPPQTGNGFHEFSRTTVCDGHQGGTFEASAPWPCTTNPRQWRLHCTRAGKEFARRSG